MIVAAEPAFRTRHANPYNALLYDAVSARGPEVREYSPRDLVARRPDIVHLHWPELTFLSSHRGWQSAARLIVFEALIAAARRRGTRLVWTVHNDGAHEPRDPRLHRRLERMLARQLDGVFTLSDAGAEAFRSRFGTEVPVFHTPHGHYRAAYPLTADRHAARAELGVESEPTLVLAVGQVRAYKNLPALISAARELDDPNLRVAVAGDPDGAGSEAALLAAAGGDPRVLLDLVLLDDARLGAWLRGADIVVLPYRRILNSGAAMLALSAGRPVVVPAVGAMPELAAIVGADWVRLYEGEFTAATLRSALEWLRGVPREAEPDLSALEWGGIADATVAAYLRLLDTPSRR
jgi:glycosyltransferase involved in cell wall biosynthesis